MATLNTNSRLGPYEIRAPIGAGGMGEVYRAHDPKLDRDVAIKILPPALSDDPSAVTRFEREAKAVAALSHPHILAIHDFGRERTIAYAVMELLEGQTLRERLAGGALPVRTANDIAVQIARGPMPGVKASLVAATVSVVAGRWGRSATCLPNRRQGRRSDRHLCVRRGRVRDGDRPPGSRWSWGHRTGGTSGCTTSRVQAAA